MLIGQDRGRPFLVRAGDGLLGEISAIVGKMAETFRGSPEYRPGGVGGIQVRMSFPRRTR
jgi:hypothetical protein